MNLSDLPNSKISELIEEWLHSEMYRRIARRNLIDGVCIEKISEEVDRSPRQTARIIRRIKEELNKHI